MDDGRHDYLAALMLGREKVFVCWLQDVEKPLVVEVGERCEVGVAL